VSAIHKHHIHPRSHTHSSSACVCVCVINRLAKQGVTVSQRQLDAYLTDGFAPGIAGEDTTIDFNTFNSLGRPRAPVPTQTPTYIRKADFSSDGKGGPVGFSAKVSN